VNYALRGWCFETIEGREFALIGPGLDPERNWLFLFEVGGEVAECRCKVLADHFNEVFRRK
jgi:hypothetical protein